MGLVFEQTSFKSRFLTQWSKYVEAVLIYAEQSSKKSVHKHMKNLDRNGMLNSAANCSFPSACLQCGGVCMRVRIGVWVVQGVRV